MSEGRFESRRRGRTLFAGAGLHLGAFECLPGDDLWIVENLIGTRHHVVFPRTSVFIHQDGRESVLADPANVVLYDPYQTYSRELVDPRGDRCSYVALEADLVAEFAGRPGEDVSWPISHAPVDAPIYLLEWTAARCASDESDVEPLALEEALLTTVGAVVGKAFETGPPPSTGTGTSELDIVNEAKIVLHARLAERLSLPEVAKQVHVSPYHLTRCFRRRTGFSLHRYRTQIRLRRSLERLPDPRVTLGEIAVELGFASHGHFTDRFTEAFGMPPSRARNTTTAAALQEMSNFVEARAKPSP